MNILNCKNKTLSFSFRGEDFVIDLTEGDLHDSWNGITLENGEIFDFNFYWEEEGQEPSAVLYETYTHNEVLCTDHTKDFSIKIDKIIGTFEEYFKEEIFNRELKGKLQNILDWNVLFREELEHHLEEVCSYGELNQEETEQVESLLSKAKAKIWEKWEEI
jgi:hypothetical protein